MVASSTTARLVALGAFVVCLAAAGAGCTRDFNALIAQGPSGNEDETGSSGNSGPGSKGDSGKTGPQIDCQCAPCTGSGCKMICPAGCDECDCGFKCPAGQQCLVSCFDRTTCTIGCPEGTVCSVTCEKGADCECTGTGCELTCTDTKPLACDTRKTCDGTCK